MRTYRRILAGLAAWLALAAPLAGQTLPVAANEANRTLTPGAFPTLEKDKTFTVAVTGLSQLPSTWTFKLGGVALQAPAALSGTQALYTLSLAEPTWSQIQFDLQNRAKLEFVDTGAPPFTLSTAVVLTGPSTRTTEAASATDPCARIADGVHLPARGYDRRRNRVALAFDTLGLPVTDVPTDIDDNDDISIFLLTNCQVAARFTVVVEGKIAEGEFTVLSQGALGDLGKVVGRLTSAAAPVASGLPLVFMGKFGPYQPSSIKIIIKKSGTEVRSHTVRILRNHHAAFRMGVGQSGNPFNSYDVRATATDTGKVITNTLGEDGEPRYFASVVFYSWQFWDPQRFWNGRDLSETPTFLDRLNPYLGFGLRDPGREFMLGATLELARGLDVVWGVHISRTEQLTNGFTEGAAFRGAKDDIPTRDLWSIRGDYFGVSADLGVAVSVLQAILGS